MHAPKALKAPKATKAPKAQRRNQAKAQNDTSEQKSKMILKTSKGKKVTYSLICDFVLVKFLNKEV